MLTKALFAAKNTTPEKTWRGVGLKNNIWSLLEHTFFSVWHLFIMKLRGNFPSRDTRRKNRIEVHTIPALFKTEKNNLERDDMTPENSLYICF